MQRTVRFILNTLFVILLLGLSVSPAAATEHLQTDTETPTETPVVPTNTSTNTPIPPTNTPVPPTNTPGGPTFTPTRTITRTPTPIPPTSTPTYSPTRPLIVASYSLPGKVQPGKDFSLGLDLYNQGGQPAYNVIVTIQGEKLIPRGNGGVQAVNQIPGATGKTLKQMLYAAPELAGQEAVTITVSVAYSDDVGTAYSTSLILLANLKNATATAASSGGGGSGVSTQTPTAAPSSKLIISSYKTSIEKLQAGNIFKLMLDIQNQGTAAARGVTMVLGGATLSGGDGTPDSGGGVSGGSADLSKFAPVGSSNLYNLGDLAPATTSKQTLELVVNVATDPGVYPLKISFVYDNAKGERLIDDQAITMLVYALPQVTVGFYDAVPDIGLGEFRALPIQITNTGKKATILGEVLVSASSGEISKNTATIGTIDTGGYFTLDPEFIPDTPGEVTLTVQINYTDDFQEPVVIEKTLTVNVIEVPFFPEEGLGPDGEEIPPPVAEESFLEKVWKAMLGFLGFSGG